MGEVGRRIQWLLLPTSVCDVGTSMSSKEQELVSRANPVDFAFLPSHDDRGTRLWMPSERLVERPRHFRPC